MKVVKPACFYGKVSSLSQNICNHINKKGITKENPKF